MSNKCYAAIDIGSNSVRLLIKKETSTNLDTEQNGRPLPKALK